MNATATSNNAPTATPQKRGFNVTRCPMCGEEGCVVSVDLDDMMFRCGNDCEFTAADVREMIGEWQKVLAWVELAPVKE